MMSWIKWIFGIIIAIPLSVILLLIVIISLFHKSSRLTLCHMFGIHTKELREAIAVKQKWMMENCDDDPSWCDNCDFIMTSQCSGKD